MIPVVQMKKDLSYSLDMADIIDVLKVIASSEFRNLSSKMEKEDALRERVLSCFSLLTSISKENPFFVEKKNVPKAFLLVCSDEGFLGEVNTAVAEAALSRGLDNGAKFLVLGERGAKILSDLGIDFIPLQNITNDIEMSHVIDISNSVMSMYEKAEISGLYVVYMRFVSFTKHHLEVVKLLPCDELIGFAKGEKKSSLNALIEPDTFSVMEYLIKLWVENNMYNIFWSSKLSEWSVRVMHLEHSSDELKEINRELKFKYFKSVHSLNDKIIREIFAARKAL